MIKKIIFAGIVILAINKTGFAPWKTRGIDPTTHKGLSVDSHEPYSVEFSELERNKTPLKNYAQNGSFTIILFKSESCPKCRVLESGYSQLQEKREDLKIVEINLPEQMQFTGYNSESAMRERLSELKDNMDRYKLCGTPHVTIFDPKLNIVAGDKCMDTEGTDSLVNWIKKEDISIDL